MSDIGDYSRKFEQWSTWTKQDIKDDKGTIAVLNALSVVAAFIAGVQGQILTICVNVSVPNGPGKKRATICALVGLLLDILGASIGVIHTLLLKQRVNDNAQILSLIAAFRDEADLFTLNTNQETGENIVEVRITKDGRRQRIEDFANKMEGRYHLNRLSNNFARVTDILDYSSGPFEVISAMMTVRFWFTTMMVSPKTSSVPLAAMGLGVACLLLSVIFLAEGMAGRTSGEFLACVIAVVTVFLTLCITIIMKFYTFLFSKVREFLRRRQQRRQRNDDAELNAETERREEYEKRVSSIDPSRQSGFSMTEA